MDAGRSLYVRSNGALTLELNGVSLVGNVLAELQAGAHVVLQQAVLGAELAETVTAITDDPKRRGRA